MYKCKKNTRVEAPLAFDDKLLCAHSWVSLLPESDFLRLECHCALGVREDVSAVNMWVFLVTLGPHQVSF